MNIIVVVFFCIAGVLAAFADKTSGRIGGKVAEVGQFPYQVSLRYLKKHKCGGSILDETTILTAASCVAWLEISSLKIVVGTNRLYDDEAPIHDVKSIVHHENYISVESVDDIAILKLFEPIEFNEKVQPLALPTTNNDLIDVVFSGWGSTHPSIYLHYIELTTVTPLTCSFLLKIRFSENQICTSNEFNLGACDGDTGGPLVDLNRNHVGIRSWTSICGTGLPDVYTRVYAYLDWIENNRY